MTDVPSAKPKDVAKALLALGFEERKAKGSHRVYRHFSARAMTTVPIHLKELAPEFVKEIAKQAGVSLDAFVKLL